MTKQTNTKATEAETKQTMELSVVQVDNSIFKTQEEGQGGVVRYSTTTDDVALFNAVNGGSEPVKDYIGKEIEVTDIVITSADVHEDVNDEDSPIVSKPCVHFYTVDGKHLTTLSNGIIKSAKMLISCGFAPCPEATVVIKFKTINTKKGTAHTFDLIKRN